MIVIAIVLLGFLAAAVFAFLTQVVKAEDTNHYSTALLMARQAALAGRTHALESILNDYGEVGTWVKQGDPSGSGTPVWAPAPGVRLTRASGEWRQAFLPFAGPYSVFDLDWANGEGTRLGDAVGSDQRLDVARDCMWWIVSSGNNGWDDNPAYFLGATLTTGRARYYEPEYYELDQLQRLPTVNGSPVRDDYVEPSSKTDTDIQTQRFSDRGATLAAEAGTPGIRGSAGYYDARWNPVSATDAASAGVARQIARYRLRYSVMVDEIDSHLRINATGRDLPTGAQINETDPNDPVNCPVANPYDPLAADTQKRRIVRYAPAAFNLGFASQPYRSSGDSACATPITLGSVLEHIFMGRGQGVNMMRNADGFPRTWPLMYRHGLLGSWGNDFPHPNYFHAGVSGTAYSLPTNLYTDGMKAINESKYGGALVGLSTAVVNPWLQAPWYYPFLFYPFQTIWAGSLTGRLQTPDSVYMAIGRSLPSEHAERQWATNFPSPWGRGLELRNPATPRDPTQRYQADVDTPFTVNLLAAPRLAIHALITAYLPRQAKALRVASVTYTQASPIPGQPPTVTQTNYYANPLEPISAPVFSRDLFIDKLWATSEGGPTPFSFTAPSRTVFDGTVSPDWFSPDWTTRVGNSCYPGGTMCMDLPVPATDAVLDDTGRLIRTDDGYVNTNPTGAGRTDETAGGLWGQGLDPETGQPWLVLPDNYTVTAPDYPPGWKVDPGAITSSATPATVTPGVPIEQTIPNWLVTGPTPTTTQTWTDANRISHSYSSSSTQGYLCSATVKYSEDSAGSGQLMATQQSVWGDVAAAFMTAVTVVRAQWTQRPGGCFDPWFDNTPGDPSTIARVGGNSDATGSGGWWDASQRHVVDDNGNTVQGNKAFRQAWDPKSYATLADFDRVFLQQLGIDINNPSATTVANGWLVNRYTKGRGGAGWGGIAPVMTIVPPTAASGTWNAGFNLRTLAGNVTSSGASVVGTPQWQRVQEIAQNWNVLYPVGDAPPAGWWTANPVGPAQPWWTAGAAAQANIDGYVNHYQNNFGLVFAMTKDGQVLSSRLRTAAMEEVINDFRYSLWGSSPGYAGTFHPLDLNGDGIVNCSAYPANPNATPQETKYHLDHFVSADANSQGPVIDPAAGHTPFCIGGNLFMGKSRFFRITVRGEVWDNVNDRMFATALNDSVVCVDTGSADQPADLRSGHTLYQRWIWEQERPQQDAPPPSPP